MAEVQIVLTTFEGGRRVLRARPVELPDGALLDRLALFAPDGSTLLSLPLGLVDDEDDEPLVDLLARAYPDADRG